MLQRMQVFCLVDDDFKKKSFGKTVYELRDVKLINLKIKCRITNVMV